MATLNGYDEASWQCGDGTHELHEAKVPGDFVIVKVTQGTSYINPHWKEDIKEALSANKLIGLYHYSTGLDAVAEAKFFYNTVKSYVGKAVLALDWESYLNVSFGKNDVAYCKKFLDELYRLSKNRALIYMSQSVTNQHDWSSIAKNHGLWVACYGQNLRQYGYKTSASLVKPKCGAWGTNITIYQYTSKGRLANWNSDLDLDIAYVSASGWKKLAAVETSTVKTETSTVNKTGTTTSTVSKPTTVNPTSKTKYAISKTGIPNKDVSIFKGKVVARDGLRVRTQPGTQYGVCSFSPLANGTVINVYDGIIGTDGLKWYYIKYNSKYGFVCADYVVKL